MGRERPTKESRATCLRRATVSGVRWHCSSLVASCNTSTIWDGIQVDDLGVRQLIGLQRLSNESKGTTSGARPKQIAAAIRPPAAPHLSIPRTRTRPSRQAPPTRRTFHILRTGPRILPPLHPLSERSTCGSAPP